MTRTRILFLMIVIVCLQGVSVAKQCTSRGKFPNDHENSCGSYTMCLLAGAAHFAQLNLTCPTGFIFNHVLSQCTNVTGYQCQPTYKCTSVGNFPNPYSEDCASFIACIEGFNDVITARSIDCPEHHVFNPDEGGCVNTTINCNHKEQDSYVEDVLSNLAEASESSGHMNYLSYSAVYLFVFNLLFVISL